MRIAGFRVYGAFRVKKQWAFTVAWDELEQNVAGVLQATIPFLI